MRIVLDIVLFAIFFNIAVVLIAATGFFPTALYGDPFELGEDPENLPTTEILFRTLVTKPTGEVTRLWGNDLTISFILGIGVIAGTGIAILTKQTTIIAMALVGYLFWTMYANSKQAFVLILADMHVSVNYIALMVLIGAVIMFIVVLMDYASGQQASSK